MTRKEKPVEKVTIQSGRYDHRGNKVFSKFVAQTQVCCAPMQIPRQNAYLEPVPKIRFLITATNSVQMITFINED